MPSAFLSYQTSSDQCKLCIQTVEVHENVSFFSFFSFYFAVIQLHVSIYLKSHSHQTPQTSQSHPDILTKGGPVVKAHAIYAADPSLNPSQISFAACHTHTPPPVSCQSTAK